VIGRRFPSPAATMRVTASRITFFSSRRAQASSRFVSRRISDGLLGCPFTRPPYPDSPHAVQRPDRQLWLPTPNAICLCSGYVKNTESCTPPTRRPSAGRFR
jgi:hypothetical protein